MEEKEQVWNWLLMYDVCTEAELQLVTDINGYTLETMNDILYARTGYRSLDQIEDAGWRY